jgi:hypothetical protein
VRWLLTVGGDVDLEELRVRLEQLDSTVDTAAVVPLGGGGRVVPAEGPTDLPARLERAGIADVSAYPDSELELYD